MQQQKFLELGSSTLNKEPILFVLRARGTPETPVYSPKALTLEHPKPRNPSIPYQVYPTKPLTSKSVATSTFSQIPFLKMRRMYTARLVPV